MGLEEQNIIKKKKREFFSCMKAKTTKIYENDTIKR